MGIFGAWVWVYANLGSPVHVKYELWENVNLKSKFTGKSREPGSHKFGSYKFGSHKLGSHKLGSHKLGSHKLGSHKLGSRSLFVNILIFY